MLGTKCAEGSVSWGVMGRDSVEDCEEPVHHVHFGLSSTDEPGRNGRVFQESESIFADGESDTRSQRSEILERKRAAGLVL